MLPVIYRRRRGVRPRGEREWRVGADALSTRGVSGKERRLAWRDVGCVRLCHSPTLSKPHRYVFEIQPKRGPKIVIDNTHYLGPWRYEERSETYGPFVRAAIDRIIVENPRAHALIGETPKRYFMLLLAGLIGFCGIALALATVATPIDHWSMTPLLKLGVILAMVPLFARWVLGAMPRGVALDEIPPRALPSIADGA
jgi:hypothetical protein